MTAVDLIPEPDAACSAGSLLIRSSCRIVIGLCQSVLLEALLGEDTMRITMVALFLIFANTSVLAVAADSGFNAQSSGPQGTTILKTDVAEVEGKEWKVRTVELSPGAVDARHFYSGVELLYVLEGTGRLEVEGKPFVALHPGAVAAVGPKKRHLLMNASQTQPLKIVVMLMPGNGQAGLNLTNRTPNANSKQQKAVEADDSRVLGLVF